MGQEMKLNCLVFKNRLADLDGQEVWTAVCLSQIPTTIGEGNTTLVYLESPPINSGPTKGEALRRLVLDVEYMIGKVAVEGTLEQIDLEIDEKG